MAEAVARSSAALFDVYLRLRPSYVPNAERFLDVESSVDGQYPTHITIKPPANDHRKRAIEKFEFTKVFQENAAQTDLFRNTGIPEIIQGVLGEGRAQGRDGLLATLGVTGSGKVRILHKYLQQEKILTPGRAIPSLDPKPSGV